MYRTEWRHASRAIQVSTIHWGQISTTNLTVEKTLWSSHKQGARRVADHEHLYLAIAKGHTNITSTEH